MIAVIAPKGNYGGKSIQAEYRVVSIDISKLKQDTIIKEYTGKEITLTTSEIYLMSGVNPPINESNYQIVEGAYRNNLKKGKGSVIIKGVGNYGGFKTITFSISSKSLQ